MTQTPKIGRQFRAEPQDVSGYGVFDSQQIGMQSLSFKGSPGRLGGGRQAARPWS